MNYSSLDILKPENKKEQKKSDQSKETENTQESSKEKIYLSKYYTNESSQLESKKPKTKEDNNESNISLVLKSLDNSRFNKNRSNKNLQVKHAPILIGSGMNSEFKNKIKPKKKKKKESANMLEIPKDFMLLILQVIQNSTVNITTNNYRKMLHNFFEYLTHIEDRAKSLSSNREFILNYLEVLLKLLIRKDINVEPSQNEELFGCPNIFPLKIKGSKLTHKKGAFGKFDKKFAIGTKNCLFNNRKHSNQVLLMFRRIAQKAQSLLGFNVEEASARLMKEKNYNTNSKKGKNYFKFFYVFILNKI
jgi:hypothetical protein